MVINIDKVSLRAHREMLWYGRATITNFMDVKDPITKITKKTEVTLFTDLPCKLSRNRIANNDATDANQRIEHTTKVSIGNEHDIPTGSIFEITQNGVTERFKYSGYPGHYIVHQEIPLVPYEDYS